MDNPSVVAQLMAHLGVCFEVLSVHIGEQAAIETILKKLEESV